MLQAYTTDMEVCSKKKKEKGRFFFPTHLERQPGWLLPMATSLGSEA